MIIRSMRMVLFALALGLPCVASLGQSASGGGGVMLTEILRLGEEGGKDSYIFGNISDLAVDSRGRIIAADNRPPSVTIFSMDGELVGSVGAEGKGPGEYTHAGGVYIGPNDSIYVADSRHNRLLVYDPVDLTYVRLIDYPYDDNWGVTTSAVGISERGPVMLYTPWIIASNVGLPRYRYAVLTSWTGQRVRELVRLPARELYTSLGANGQPTAMTIKYARNSVFRLSAGQVLYSGWNAAIDIQVTSLTGDSVRTIRRPHEPVRLTRADIPAGLDADVRKMYPEAKPAYRTFVVDDQDYIWVKDYVEPPASEARWQLLDSKGALVSEILLPRDLVLHIVTNDRAYGVRRGESGEDMLVVYKVEY